MKTNSKAEAKFGICCGCQTKQQIRMVIIPAGDMPGEEDNYMYEVLPHDYVGMHCDGSNQVPQMIKDADGNPMVDDGPAIAMNTP